MADSVGRISKEAFIGTTSAFLGLCIIATAVRCYIRFRIQKKFGWEDGFLLLGLICGIGGISLILSVMDTMFDAEAMMFGDVGLLTLTATDLEDMIRESSGFRGVLAAALTLIWTSICSVKFCFLMFFKGLIRQMPAMIRYWWFALIFNVLVAAYGTVVYFVVCPYFKAEHTIKSIQCVQGDGLVSALHYSIASMVLDIASDILILVIPVVLLWKIRINWMQKVGLAFTLCLTVIMVIITITRISGLKWKDKLDMVWENFFFVIAAEIGLTLVAVTAFRALYVSKAKNRKIQNTITTFNWYNRGKSFIVDIVSRATGRSASEGSGDLEMNKGNDGFLGNDIPNATMTGMKTFIDGNGKTGVYATMDEEL